MKDEIKQIVAQFDVSFACPGDEEGMIQAIVDLVKSQPVDRVRAMAALVMPLYESAYAVPDLNTVYLVLSNYQPWMCGCGGKDCEHVQAVELWMRWNENDQR